MNLAASVSHLHTHTFSQDTMTEEEQMAAAIAASISANVQSGAESSSSTNNSTHAAAQVAAKSVSKTVAVTDPISRCGRFRITIESPFIY